MHLYKFVEGKPTDSIPTLQKKIQKKRKVIKTKEDKATLDEAEKILLDYHRRRRYDDMGDFQMYLPLISQEKFFNSFIEPMVIASSLSKSRMKKDNSSSDGKTYVHTYQYQNINGKEKEKEDKYVIDKNGKKKKLPLVIKKN